MKMLKLWRTFREGGRNYRRNGWLTFATVSVLTLCLFVMSLTVFIGFAGHLAIRNLQNRISITVSFQPEVSEARILAIKDELSQYREIASVEYESQDQALQKFLANGDPILRSAVEDIGGNPLLSSLIIHASKSAQYDLIASEIEHAPFHQEISRINYEKNKHLIEQLNHLTINTQKIGLVLGIIFMLISVLITWNTIRLTIYSQRQEFEVMRLVGASNLYIKMPFFFEGIFYGLTAAIVTVILLGVVIGYFSQPLRPLAESAIGTGNILMLYLRSLWYIFPSIILLGALLGILSSFIAIRRYLKI